MRWEDERYVRVYTRDTPDWLCLSFLAQGLFCLLLRKVDRAGVLPLGRLGKKGVAVAIGHAHQWPMLEPALEELLADGCVEINGTTLVVPNFIEAQEALQSDKARARTYRERVRDGVTRQSRGVSDRHAPTQPRDAPVTPCDARITGCDKTVTPSRAVPCRTDLPPTPLGKNGTPDQREQAAAAWAVLAPVLRSRVRAEWLEQLMPEFRGSDLVLLSPSRDIAEHLQRNHAEYALEHVPEALHLTGTVRFEAVPNSGGAS